MQTSLKIMALATIALTMGSCNTPKGLTVNSPATPAQERATVSTAKTQLNGDWIVTNIDGTPVESTNQLSLSFVNDDENPDPNIIKVYGNTGCNTVNGAFRLADGYLMSPAGEFLSTLKACPDAPFEPAFNKALTKVTHFSVKVINNESILYLTDTTGDLVMTLRKHNINYINGAWAALQIAGHEVPADANIKFVIDLPEQKIHGNAGCNVLNGTVTIDMNRENGLSFSKLFTTRMTCPHIALEQLLIQALEQTTQCSEGPVHDEAMLLDAAGKPIVVMKRINIK